MQEKMRAVIDEINREVAEREEAVHCIALALLTRKNLFILGDTGQAKSFVIDQFKRRIDGARLFDVLMSKQMDQDQLFGRLDLASIIPGNVAQAVLEQDEYYENLKQELHRRLMLFRNNNVSDNELEESRGRLETYRKSLAELFSGKPSMVTDSKIPDSDIVFLDELFKANEGVINSLLKALNERQYTNEGVTVDLSVVSFFSASNEIPDFSNQEERILRPLYDRFDLKVVTEYIKESGNRQAVLAGKQTGGVCVQTARITMDELAAMQADVRKVIIPESINRLSENLLIALRDKGLHISDRKFLNYGHLVQAEAWLFGRYEVHPEDLSILTCYYWTTPQEIDVIREEIGRQTTNPLKNELEGIYTAALNHKGAFDQTHDFYQLRDGLLELYLKLCDYRNQRPHDDPAQPGIQNEISRLEDVHRQASDASGIPYHILEIVRQVKRPTSDK